MIFIILSDKYLYFDIYVALFGRFLEVFYNKLLLQMKTIYL